MALDYVQTNTLYLAGSGVIIGAVTITLTTLTDIYANVLTMASFGAKGYGTLEPDTTNEEGFTFTGITANANLTYTLTGVKTILAQSPYTESVGLIRQHSGGTKLVITDNVAFWNTFGNKQNDEVLVGRWSTPVAPLTGNDIVNKTYADGLAIAGAPDSSTTTKGIGKVSVAPVSPTSPIFVGDNDPRVPTQGENDALVGNNTDIAVGTGNKFITQTGLQHNAEKYAVDTSGSSTAYVAALSPVPTSLTAGMIVYIKFINANTTTTPTLTLTGTATAKTIVKIINTALISGDIGANQIYPLIYDGTNFVLQAPVANIPSTIYTNGTTTKNSADASVTQNIPHGLGKIPKYVKIVAQLYTIPPFIPTATTVYNGTTQSSLSCYGDGSAAGHTTGSTSFIISTGRQDLGFNGNTGTVTFDATNIIITWINTAGSSGTFSLMWEAQANT